MADTLYFKASGVSPVKLSAITTVTIILFFTVPSVYDLLHISSVTSSEASQTHHSITYNVLDSVTDGHLFREQLPICTVERLSSSVKLTLFTIKSTKCSSYVYD